MIRPLFMILHLLMLLAASSPGLSNPLRHNERRIGSWQIISTVPNSVSVIFFIDSLRGWAAGSGGIILASTDGGSIWTPQNSGTTATLRSLHFLDPSIGFASGNNRTLLSTTNGGVTWTTLPVVSDSGTIYTSLGSDGSGCIYFLTNYGEIYRSLDSGVSWQNIHTLGQTGFSYLNYSHTPVCFAMKASGNVLYRSTDGGTVWDTVRFSFSWSGDLYFLNKDTGWVTENWGPSSSQHDSVSVHFTSDGGVSWTRRSTLPGLVLSTLHFINGAEGWSSMTQKIFHTSDGGVSWEDQFSSDSIGFIRDLFMLHSDRGWVVTSSGKVLRYSTSSVVSVLEPDVHPEQFMLFQNYPNPFNPTTVIGFTVSARSEVRIIVSDLLGRTVAELMHEVKAPGTYSVRWDGSGHASGIYFYQLTAGPHRITNRMMLVR